MTDLIISPSGISPGKARSEVVRDLIKGSSFSNREVRTEVDELLRIERFILEGVHSYASALLYRHLKGKYPVEWARIFEELKPGEFEIVKRQEERRLEDDKRRREMWRLEERDREALARKDWLAIGGMP